MKLNISYQGLNSVKMPYWLFCAWNGEASFGFRIFGVIFVFLSKIGIQKELEQKESECLHKNK